MARGENYEKFIEKFKPKKTTDDCYTPPEIYEVVKDWAVEEYGLGDRPIVRPFYPGGDFENFPYLHNCVVLDNPPFSIFSKIVQFYEEKGIDYFLFAPHLTLFSSLKKTSKACFLVADAVIKYANGAVVSTSFVTNLDSYKVRTVPVLTKKIKEVGRSQSQNLKYNYPPEVITSAMLGKLVDGDADFRLKAEEVHFIRHLEAQKVHKKTIFGAGFLISAEKAKEKEELEKRAIEKAKEQGKIIEWELSEKEREIVKTLGKERSKGN